MSHYVHNYLFLLEWGEWSEPEYNVHGTTGKRVRHRVCSDVAINLVEHNGNICELMTEDGDAEDQQCLGKVKKKQGKNLSPGSLSAFLFLLL